MLQDSTHQKRSSEACGVGPHREWGLPVDILQNITEKLLTNKCVVWGSTSLKVS